MINRTQKLIEFEKLYRQTAFSDLASNFQKLDDLYLLARSFGHFSSEIEPVKEKEIERKIRYATAVNLQISPQSTR